MCHVLFFYWGHHSELDRVAALKGITFYYQRHTIKNKCVPGSNNDYKSSTVGPRNINEHDLESYFK